LQNQLKKKKKAIDLFLYFESFQTSYKIVKFRRISIKNKNRENLTKHSELEGLSQYTLNFSYIDGVNLT
jgi:hypothetical protein